MVTVGRIVEGAFGLIREHFVAVLIWAGVYLVGNIAVLLTVAPMMQSAFGGGMADSPEAIIGMMAPVYALNLLLLLVGVVLYTAAMRAVLRPQAGGLGFLRLGMDELRMFVLLILFVIAGFIIGFGFALLAGLLTAGVAVGGNSPATTILLSLVIGLAVFALFLFLIIRFSLAFPLTLHRRQFVLGEAWSLSKGRFWTLFGAALVVSVIGFVLTMVVASFAMGGYMADIMAASGDPEAAAAIMERKMGGGLLQPAMILQSVAGSVIGAIWIALSGGSAATATKLLLEDEFDDAEEVFG